jgi:hypothetical protein
VPLAANMQFAMKLIGLEEGLNELRACPTIPRSRTLISPSDYQKARELISHRIKIRSSEFLERCHIVGFYIREAYSCMCMS